MTITDRHVPAVAALHDAAAHGPVALGRTLAASDPSLQGGFAPHLHVRLRGWTLEALALAIDTRDEHAYTDDLSEPYTLADIVAAIRDCFATEDVIDYADPLAFAYQRVIEDDRRRTYCEVCDYPVWWEAAPEAATATICDLCR